jgi:hypothetical protein
MNEYTQDWMKPMQFRIDMDEYAMYNYSSGRITLQPPERDIRGRRSDGHTGGE